MPYKEATYISIIKIIVKEGTGDHVTDCNVVVSSDLAGM